MAISEHQLEVWSHQGSTQQSAATYQTIKRVLEDPRAPFSNRGFTIFLQGSYGNDTNIYADSDVDIVICLTSVYYSDTNNLDPDEKTRYEANRNPASYKFSDFKTEVTDWLTLHFGSGVTSGNKAIFVPGSSGRRDADVIACVENHDYFSYPDRSPPEFHSGIAFWTNNQQKIVNYPKQHLSNCSNKNGNTRTRFKPDVRVLKNMRNAAVDDGVLSRGKSPSYFLEGMLYNIPNQLFDPSRQTTFENAFSWLSSCNLDDLVCANERFYLVRDGLPNCWKATDFRDTLAALTEFWRHGAR
ncbi:MAG: nucleotidyltransferase [Pseudomonadota bacterium]|nr:nucleotidyltransferase [Pseudomonadota bacterium]